MTRRALNKNTKKAGKWYVAHFIMCVAAFFVASSVFFIYYGPFTNIRDYIVSTSMGTNGNKIFATMFFDQSQINSILARTNSVVKDGNEDVNAAVVKAGRPAGQQVPTAQAPASGTSGASAAPSSTAQSDKGITVIDVSGPDFKGKLMEISDPSKVVLGLAPKLGQVGAPLSEIVHTYGAVGGVNAGGFLDDNLLGTGANPDGIVVVNGQVKFRQQGLNTYNVIGFNTNNVLVVRNAMTMQQIQNGNLRCAVSFGPALIINGQPLVTSGGSTLQPRTAIGQKKDGTVLLLVIDGRQSYSKGANYLDVQNVLLQYGAYNAANLDGGSSSTMNYQGKTLNRPCDITGERSVATAFLVMN